MNFSLTSDQLAELTPAEFAQIDPWLADIAFVETSRPKDPAARLVAARRGISVRTVYNKIKAYSNGGATALLDGRDATRRQLRTAPVGHRSPAFIQWVHDLYYETKRNNATPAVHDRMLAHLRAWRLDPTNPKLRIPGYSTPPLDSADSGYRHPYGWSIRNLNEIKPDKFQRAEAGKGRHASNLLLPPILTTRIGLAVGAAYMLDDQQYDLLVHYGPRTVRPVGLNVLDLASGCDVLRGLRPILDDAEDGEKTLGRAHALWTIVHLLSVDGYHPKGCQLIVESGAATLGEEFTKFLRIATDDAVTVNVGEVAKDLVRGVLTPSRGNPKHKAPRESWFNLFRNHSGHLPLALGMNPGDKPEDTDRIANEERYLLSLVEALSPAVISELQFEGLPWSRFVPVVHLISEAINRRTRHDLEGWAAMGRERTQFLVGGEWIDEPEWLDLAPDTRALVVARMRRGEIVSRVEQLSPREVFEAGRSELKTISPWHWDKLIPPSQAIRCKIPGNRQIVIDRREFGPEPIQFRAHYLESNGGERPLPAGAEILLYLSPIDPAYGLAIRADGTRLGLVHAIDKGGRLDQEALFAQHADRNRLRVELTPTAAEHNAKVATRRQSRRDHNAAILRANGVPEKKVRKVERPYPNATHHKPKKPTPPKETKPFKTPDENRRGLGILRRVG